MQLDAEVGRVSGGPPPLIFKKLVWRKSRDARAITAGGRKDS